MRDPTWLLLPLAAACSPPVPSGARPQPDSAAADSGAANVPDRIQLGEVQACADPVDGPTWVESGLDLGLTDWPEGITDGGAAVADLDQDGFLDLFLVRPAGAPPVFWGGPDGFEVGEPTELIKVYSVGLADLDGDDRLELLVSGGQPALIWVEGRALRRSLLDAIPSGSAIRELRPLDLDGDGDLDLYAARTRRAETTDDLQDLLLINDGQGGFADAGPVLPAPQTAALSFDVVLVDANADQQPDLYLVHDQGRSFGGNVLLLNDGGMLRDASPGTGLDRAEGGMGGASADFNGDGQQDFILANSAGVALLLRGEDLSWVEATAAWQANPVPDPREMPWAAVPLDYDNDGRVDLMVSQGPFADHSDSGASDAPQPIHLLHNDGAGFTSDTDRLGAAPLGTWRAMVAEDFNGDGVLDLLVTSAVERPLLYLSQGCTAAAWLAVEGPEGTEVTVEAGGRRQVAILSSDSGYGASQQPRAWFGLGEAPELDSLSLRLPGSTEEIGVQGPITARRRVRILR